VAQIFQKLIGLVQNVFLGELVMLVVPSRIEQPLEFRVIGLSSCFSTHDFLLVLRPLFQLCFDAIIRNGWSCSKGGKQKGRKQVINFTYFIIYFLLTLKYTCNGYFTNYSYFFI
jgi:hypothetical protein